MDFINSKLFDVGALLYDLIIINILILIGCIPIITVFVSLTTGFQMVRDLRAGKDQELLKRFAYKYKENLIQGSYLNLLGLMWCPVIYKMGTIVIESNNVFVKIVLIMAIVEIAMGIVGSLVLIEKRVRLLELIRQGIVHFHIHWVKYIFISMSACLLVVVILFTRILMPLMLSAIFYSMDFCLAFFSRKTEGDNPNVFLNVLEKTS